MRSDIGFKVGVFMAVVLFCVTVVAEQTVPVRLILGYVMKRRVNPASYELDFTIKRNSVGRTNEKNAQLSGGLVQIVGTMRIDELAEASYVESTAKLLDVIAESDDRQQSLKSYMEKNRHLGMSGRVPKLLRRQAEKGKRGSRPLFSLKSSKAIGCQNVVTSSRSMDSLTTLKAMN